MRVNGNKLKILALVIIALSPASSVLSQTPSIAPPSFEVAAVKPNKSGSERTDFQPIVGGRLSIYNVTLKTLILSAYRRMDWEVMGGPDWIDSDRFDIVAKAEDSAPVDQVMLMLQTLLKERFKLNVHAATQQGTILAMTVGKNGHKLQAAKGGTGSGVRLQPVPGRDGVIQATGQNMTMPHLATVLSNQLHQPVVDRTGLEGIFDFSFKLELGNGNSGGLPTEVVIMAVNEELGLKLEAQKAPIETLVIDGAERPTGNARGH